MEKRFVLCVFVKLHIGHGPTQTYMDNVGWSPSLVCMDEDNCVGPIEGIFEKFGNGFVKTLEWWKVVGGRFHGIPNMSGCVLNPSICGSVDY